jgi:2-polyprenyl-3-methyl-5-hydroxy-6-metoxy-1,4-benzoquinol methylase/ribosomal protein S27E
MTDAAADGSIDRLSETELCPEYFLKGQEEAFQRDIDRLFAQRGAFVPVACPACGETAADPVFEKYGFEYVRCVSCLTLYMTPRPPPEVMATYYAASENYRYWADHIFPASEAARRAKIHRPRLDQIVDYCHRFHVPRGTLLEVGPGFGTFAALAADSGHFQSVVTVEPTPEMAEACRERGLNVIESRIEDMGNEIADADVVVSFEVIEHLFAPKAFVAKSARLLRPDGLLVLTCPNGEGFDIAVLGPHSPAVDPEHQNLFNTRSLARLVEDCGFEVLEATTPGRLDAEFVREAALAGKIDLSGDPFLKRVLVDEWERLGQPFQRFLAEHGLSSHMWLVARK